MNSDTLHNRTVPSTWALASSWPLGLNATASTLFAPVWRGVPMGWPVAGSHNRTVPSPPALASSWPLGLNATSLTPAWALATWRGTPTGRPVAGFHN